MGGDGTFREVGAGLLASKRREDVALAMLPTGTANDQGRSFGLDATDDALEKNLSIAAAAIETRLDAGILRDAKKATVFFDSAGWGISARVLAQRNADRAWIERIEGLREIYRDQLVYAGALVRVFLESYVVDDKFSARLDADGMRHDLAGLTDLIVKGTRVYGGAWVFDKSSRHDDGAFEVVPFRGKRDWTSKAIVDLDGNPLDEEAWNTIGIEHSKPIRAAKMRFSFAPPRDVPLHAQVDGEELTFEGTEAEIEVVPRAIRLIVP
jgi:diacylglycerol kinase family enzyme